MKEYFSNYIIKQKPNRNIFKAATELVLFSILQLNVEENVGTGWSIGSSEWISVILGEKWIEFSV